MSFTTVAGGRHAVVGVALLLVLVCQNRHVVAQTPELFQQIDQAAEGQIPQNSDAMPVRQGSSFGFNYEIVKDQAVLEGDILLGQVNANGALISELAGRAIGLSSRFTRWPHGIVPYQFNNNSQIQLDNIARAIAHWTERTTVSFVERTDENSDQYPNYIRFDNTASCASHVGMLGNGGQPVYVSDSCSTGSIIHEIGHALGLFHEHTRPDRDNYVQIDWSLIVPGKEINFEILNVGIENYGDYDYGSIMHYGESFFSSNGNSVITVPDGIEIGQRIALSEKDIAAVNQMYAADLALAEPISSQSSDGIEIEVNVSNLGELGAHDLQLLVKLGEESVWKGMSANSNWDCLSYEHELQCTQRTMDGESDSEFTLLVDPGNTSIDDLSMTLSARNLDPDTSNNGYNESEAIWHLLEAASEELLAENERAGSDENSLSTVPSMTQPELGSATSTKQASTDSGSTGRTSITLLILLMLACCRQLPKRLIPQGRTI